MSDVLVLERVCGACGTANKPDSEYCSNCGKSLISKQLDIEVDDENPLILPSISSKDSAAGPREPDGGIIADAEGNKLESASSLRKKPRSPRKKAEVVWEPETGPGIGFLVTTLVLVAFAAIVVILALYYR